MPRGQGRWTATLAALWAVCGPAPAVAGAYTLEKGEAKLFVTGMLASGDRYYDRHGKLKPRGDYKKYDLQAYAEYGVSDRITLFGATGLQRIKASDQVGRHAREGLGRSEAGARLRLFQRDGWVASVQSSAVIAGAKAKEGIAAIGESDDQFDIRGLVAHSFASLSKPTFLEVQAGYRARSGDPADEVRFDATLGIRQSPRTQMFVQSFNTFGTGTWRGPYRLKQRIHKVQIAVLYDVTDRLSVIAAAFATPIGRDALDERGVTLGIGWKY